MKNQAQLKTRAALDQLGGELEFWTGAIHAERETLRSIIRKVRPASLHCRVEHTDREQLTTHEEDVASLCTWVVLQLIKVAEMEVEISGENNAER